MQNSCLDGNMPEKPMVFFLFIYMLGKPGWLVTPKWLKARSPHQSWDDEMFMEKYTWLITHDFSNGFHEFSNG